MELFSERGYHRVSMPTIAAHLNLSLSTVYHTFGSKPALFKRALQHSCRACRLPGLSELKNSVSVRSALLRVFKMVARDQQRPPCALNLLIEARRGLPHHKQEISRLIEDTLSDLEACFREAVERAISATEVDSDVDPIAVARVLLSLYLAAHVLADCGSDEDWGLSAVLHQVHSLLPAPSWCSANRTVQIS